MDNVLTIMQSIVPEIGDLFATRLLVLRILEASPHRMGRKALAQESELTERGIRTILDTLKEQALVDVNHLGVKLTYRGKRLIESIEGYLLQDDQNNFFEMQEAIKRHLGIKNCLIVPGDADNDEIVYRNLGVQVQRLLMDFLPEGDNTIAVTGGSTLAKVAEFFTSDLQNNRNLTFVPSRGGLGSNVSIQSNSVGSRMASKTLSNYVPLFIPENLDEETSAMLVNSPMIKQVVEMSKQANCLLLSVGTAEVMAERRNITPKQYEIIRKKEAVGEAFGLFFDEKGEEVISYPRIGLTIADLQNIPLIVTIVGGASKAKAVEAFFKLVPSQSWLFCDEGIAKTILMG